MAPNWMMTVYESMRVLRRVGRAEIEQLAGHDHEVARSS